MSRFHGHGGDASVKIVFIFVCFRSRLIPCSTLTTSADILNTFKKIFVSHSSSSSPVSPSASPPSSPGSSALFVEIGGDRLRRLDDNEAPLKLLLQFLVDLGIDDEAEAKTLAADVIIESIVKFYLGEFWLFTF